MHDRKTKQCDFFLRSKGTVCIKLRRCKHQPWQPSVRRTGQVTDGWLIKCRSWNSRPPNILYFNIYIYFIHKYVDLLPPFVRCQNWPFKVISGQRGGAGPTHKGAIPSFDWKRGRKGLLWKEERRATLSLCTSLYQCTHPSNAVNFPIDTVNFGRCFHASVVPAVVL